jgi:hypothetical protein
MKSQGVKLLYTVQKPGFAISLRQFVSREFLDVGTAFHTMLFRMARHMGPDPWQQIAHHLGWNSWITCFEQIEDYNNEWIAFENLIRGDLWTLSIPLEEIRWCSLDAQCENQLPVERWFCPYPEIIRKHGQTPQALVQLPLRDSGLVKVERSEDVFKKAGLWSSELAGCLTDFSENREGDANVIPLRR